jgi:thiol:disulfide interchange protein
LNKPLLYISIALTGILLGFLNYTFKPALDEKLLQQYAQNMTNSTEWQGRIAPDFELKTTRGEHFQLSENIGKKIIVLNFFATWCGPVFVFCNISTVETSNFTTGLGSIRSDFSGC